MAQPRNVVTPAPASAPASASAPEVVTPAPASPASAPIDPHAEMRARWVASCKRLANAKGAKWDRDAVHYVPRKGKTSVPYPSVSGRFTDADKLLILAVGEEAAADANVRGWTYRGLTGHSVSPTFALRVLTVSERTASLL